MQLQRMCAGKSVAAVLALLLAACGGDDSPTGTSTAAPAPPPAPSASSLSISGKPDRQAKVDQTYIFQPTVALKSGSTVNNNGNNLKFNVSSKPEWATFNTNNGRLSGKPKQQDVGTYDNIVITASSDEGDSSLEPFSIEVVDYGNLTVTRNCTPPTETEDGSPLDDLAGYRNHNCTTPGNYETVVNVDNAGLTSYVLNGLVASEYYFVITAYNASGVESHYSNEAAVSLGDG